MRTDQRRAQQPALAVGEDPREAVGLALGPRPIELGEVETIALERQAVGLRFGF